MGQIRIEAEAVGGNPLVRVFECSDVGKNSIESILRCMIEGRWQGKDLTASDALQAEMGSSGGYAVTQKIGGDDLPVVFDPVRLNAPIREYEEDIGDNMPVVRIAVNGYQEVGSK